MEDKKSFLTKITEAGKNSLPANKTQIVGTSAIAVVTGGLGFLIGRLTKKSNKQ